MDSCCLEDMKLDLSCGNSGIYERNLSYSNVLNCWIWGKIKLWKCKTIRKSQLLLDLLMNSEDLQLEDVSKLIKKSNRKRTFDASQSSDSLSSNSLHAKTEPPVVFQLDNDFHHNHDDETSSEITIKEEECEETPTLIFGDIYFIPHETKSFFVKAILKAIDSSNTHFEFTEVRSKKFRIVPASRIALLKPPGFNLKLTQRVIGAGEYLKATGELTFSHSFELGVVAELPSAYNRFRYLVFFDNGNWLYLKPSHVRQVMEPSKHPWEELPQPQQDELKEFFENLDKKLVELERGDFARIKLNGINIYFKFDTKSYGIVKK